MARPKSDGEHKARRGRLLPFDLDRASADSLKSQLAEGLSQAIREGCYASGETLPSIAAVAAATGVSDITVRGAYRRLAAEGLVVARPRIGTVVRPPKTPIWRGHVLCVMTDYDFNINACGVIGRLRERLTGNGYLFSQVMVLRDDAGKFDFAGLDVALSRPVDFIVLVGGYRDIESRLSASGVPFAAVGGGGPLFSGCVGRVQTSKRSAMAQFARKCVRRRISTIALVRFRSCQSSPPAFAAAFAGTRVSVRDVALPEGGLERRADHAMHEGYSFVERCLRRRSFQMPDLFFADDDWLARGMLAAFAAHGVRIPEDVRFACNSNGGFRPICNRSVAVIERDSYANGAEVARRVFGWLVEHRAFPASALEASFVEGETFP